MINPIADSEKRLVVDASVMINLAATKHAEKILQALPNDVICTAQVVREVEQGRLTGRTDFEVMQELIRSESLTVEALDEQAGEIFLSLVSGSAEATLGDGEASTIALATVESLIPIMDDRKAIRICKLHHPDLEIAATVDVLSHPNVQQALGSVLLAESIRNALDLARMRVPERNMNWVLGIIGKEQARFYGSLPFDVKKRC